jgi:hypothetical protein
VPQESIFPMRPLYCGSLTMCRKMPSAMVERQMLPRQTKRTDTGSDISLVLVRLCNCHEVGKTAVGGKEKYGFIIHQRWCPAVRRQCWELSTLTVRRCLRHLNTVRNVWARSVCSCCCFQDSSWFASYSNTARTSPTSRGTPPPL